MKYQKHTRYIIFLFFFFLGATFLLEAYIGGIITSNWWTYFLFGWGCFYIIFGYLRYKATIYYKKLAIGTLFGGLIFCSISLIQIIRGFSTFKDNWLIAILLPIGLILLGWSYKGEFPVPP